MLINSQLNEQIISARSREVLYRQDNKSLSRMTSATEAVPAKAVNPVLRMSSMTEKRQQRDWRKIWMKYLLHLYINLIVFLWLLLLIDLLLQIKKVKVLTYPKSQLFNLIYPNSLRLKQTQAIGYLKSPLDSKLKTVLVSLYWTEDAYIWLI